MTYESLDGHHVVGVPASSELEKSYPTVTGRLEVSEAEFMGDKYNVFTVHCKYEDGDDCPIEVKEDVIWEVSERRKPPTVFPMPGKE